MNNHVEMAEYLISAGADIEARNQVFMPSPYLVFQSFFGISGEARLFFRLFSLATSPLLIF